MGDNFIAWIAPKGGGLMASATNRQRSRRAGGSRSKSSPPRPDDAVMARLSELEPIVSVLSDDIKPLARSLATNCARLSVTLDSCWADYSRNGAVVEYDNGGGQSGVRENPAYACYIQASRELGSAIGKLVQMVGPGTVAADALTDWQDDQRAVE